MPNSRLTSYILLFVNLVLVMFIMTRAGSEDIAPNIRHNPPLEIRHLTATTFSFPDTLTLNDFEKYNDMTNMYPQGGRYDLSLDSGHVTHGRHSLLIKRDSVNNMELATVHFPQNWAGYDFLQFDLYNDSENEGSVWVRFGNMFDNKRFYINSQKYRRDFLIKPGTNTISIPMTDIISSFGRIPQHKSLHINFPADGGTRYFMDHLRLVRK